MGRHVAEGRRRGVAGWPLVVLGVVVLLVAGTIGYFAVLRKDNNADNGPCSGSVTLTLLASSGASPAARSLSDAFNATGPTARSTCLKTAVTSLPSPAAAAALIGSWKGRSDPQPGVWLTDNASTLLEVDADASDLTAGRAADPLATSPVVLAMRPDAAAELNGVSWTDLPQLLHTDPSKSGNGPALVLSDPRTSRASAYALESMLSRSNAAPTVTEIRGAAQELTGMRDYLSDLPTIGDALDQVAGGKGAAAVPVTEADLATYNAGADHPLTAVHPAGHTAGDQVFAVALTANWMTPTLRDAASRFTAFTRSKQGSSVLAAAHLRLTGAAQTGGSAPPGVTALPAAAPGVADALAAELGLAASKPADSSDPVSSQATDPAPSGPDASGTGLSPAISSPTSPISIVPTSAKTTAKSTATAPAKTTAPPATSTPKPPPGPNVTFLVDTAASWAADINGKSRLQWLQAGLTSALAGAGTTGVGLWSTSSQAGDEGYVELVPAGPLTGKVKSGTRQAALTTAISQLSAGGGKRYYASTPAVLTKIAGTATAGVPHRLVLITDGADQTPSTPRAGVVAALQAIVAANPHVKLQVIGVGNAAPAGALGALAAAGAGTYSHANTADLPAAMAAAVKG